MSKICKQIWNLWSAPLQHFFFIWSKLKKFSLLLIFANVYSLFTEKCNSSLYAILHLMFFFVLLYQTIFYIIDKTQLNERSHDIQLSMFCDLFLFSNVLLKTRWWRWAVDWSEWVDGIYFMMIIMIILYLFLMCNMKLVCSDCFNCFLLIEELFY